MDFTKQVIKLHNFFTNYANDYYNNAPLVKRLIYKEQIFDRYNAIIDEFSTLKCGIYSDKYIEKAKKQNKNLLAVNVYRSRALGLLAIADALDKYEINYKTMYSHQKEAYYDILSLRQDIIQLAKENLILSNNLAKEHNLQLSTFNVDKKYLNNL